MAISSGLKKQPSSEEIGELLEKLGKLIDRTKVMYEQYFMGIQKLPPAQLQRDIERRVRELTQLNIRNTGLRFRFATLTQKFGSYNTYWKRTMRKIERGEYVRDVARVTRKAARRGEEVPDEVLSKLPKRVRDRILRDREKLAERAAREEARAREAEEPGRVRNPERGVHVLDEDLDLDAIFDSLTTGDESPASQPPAAEAAPREPSPTAAPAGRLPATRSRRPSFAKSPGSSSPRGSRPEGARPRASGAAPPPGMSEREGRELFEKYRKARQMVGDSRPVSYEGLMSKLGKQAPQIMRQHNARSVGFSVVIKGDKVVLKAKPER